MSRIDRIVIGLTVVMTIASFAIATVLAYKAGMSLIIYVAYSVDAWAVALIIYSFKYGVSKRR